MRRSRDSFYFSFVLSRQIKVCVLIPRGCDALCRHLSWGFNAVCAPPSFAFYLEKFCPVASLVYTPKTSGKTSGKTGGSCVTGTERGHETDTSRTLHMSYNKFFKLFSALTFRSVSVSSGSLQLFTCGQVNCARLSPLFTSLPPHLILFDAPRARCRMSRQHKPAKMNTGERGCGVY